MPAALAYKTQWIAPEDYLKIERAATHKSEYFDGEMFLMAGASREHSAIMIEITAIVRDQLRGKPCRPFSNDTRVKIPNKNYCYPDLTIACKSEWEGKQFDTLLNPVVIFEILSPSTESWDRGGKFREYQRIVSLREYVLVSQDKPLIEIYARRADGWMLRSVEGRDAIIALESIENSPLGNLILPLHEIYERVVFEEIVD